MARERTDMDDTMEGEAVGRLERLRESVSRVRGGRRMDADRLQLIVGGLLAAIGLIAIILGWYGAANTGIGFEQTPYLISGGLLGLALVFLGGFVYFAYWVTRLVRETRAQADRAAAILDEIHGSLNGSSPAGARPKAIAGGANGAFVATRSGNLFHLPTCSVVAGRSNLKRVSAKTRGLEPCAICDPLGEE